MTDALCFNCGGIKFGALVPCFTCGAGATGDIKLDIAFSDHHFSRVTLEQFGKVIQAIKPHASNPEIGFWAFIAYVSRHHSDILQAEPPPQVAAAVEALLARAELPAVVVERPQRRESGKPPEPTTELALPKSWMDAYRAKHPFQLIARVEVLNRDGEVLRGHLIDGGRTENLIVNADALAPDDVQAIRPARGCLPSFGTRPWIPVDAPAKRQPT
jgi:hypothetical protein